MKTQMFRRLALGFGLTAMLATSGLQASMFYTEKAAIPFEFRYGKRVYEAGEYRIEQDFGKDVAYLVNVRTGKKIQILRPISSRGSGKSFLTFENDGGVRILKTLS
uniref:Uncharacterized protein n=1 Tax=Solibacter usitatus (strain Ellin6076) TaxID=234267 RepID=Q02AE2_SOLUE